MMSGNVFCISFYNNGFEAIINLTEIDELAIMAKMQDEEPRQTVNSILNMLTIRARYNAERRMEVWIIKLSDEFTTESLEAWSEANPQELVDIVRENGECMYGKTYSEPSLIK